MAEPDVTGGQAGKSSGRASLVKRLAPLVLLAVAVVAAFALGLDDYISFDALRENREALLKFVESRLVVAILLFVAVYGAAVAVSLPGGALLTMTGGFLFGPWLGTAGAVVGATIGATLVFLIAKTSLGDALRARAGPALKKMEAGFQENALSYLLVLRLIPLFPFWLVNLVPAFLGVKLSTYVLGTSIGIIPGAFVFAYAGTALGSIFDSGESFSPASVLTPEIIVALVGLAALSLVPVVYKKFKARRG